MLPGWTTDNSGAGSSVAESVQLAPGNHSYDRPDLGRCFWNPLEGYLSAEGSTASRCRRTPATNRLKTLGLTEGDTFSTALVTS